MKKIFLLTLSLLGLFSCRSLPSLQPFAKQTADVTTSIRQSFVATQTFVDGLDTLNINVLKFKKVWSKTGQTDSSLLALNDYANALAELADAGKKGNEFMDKMVKSVGGLSLAAGAGAAPASAVILLD